MEEIKECPMPSCRSINCFLNNGKPDDERYWVECPECGYQGAIDSLPHKAIDEHNICSEAVEEVDWISYEPSVPMTHPKEKERRLVIVTIGNKRYIDIAQHHLIEGEPLWTGFVLTHGGDVVSHRPLPQGGVI
jgi:hypothetical protein